MKKKVVAVILSTAMAAMALTGCGNSKSSSSSASGSTESASVEAGDNFNETGYPIVKEPITLKVMQGIRDVDSLTDPSEMPAIQRLEEETGINLEWEVVKASDWSTKLNLMFASGEYPDIILTPNTTVDEEKYGVSQKLLIPLNDDLTSKYMPNYTERREAEEEDPTSSLTASDGNKYSIGYMVSQNINTAVHYFINDDWLNRLGLDRPTNVEELTDVLRAFKAEDANGNGDASDEVPLEMSMDNGYYGVRYMLPMFGVPADTSKWIYIDDDKKVQFTATQDGFRECMEWLHTCYEEGLVDAEMISQDQNTVESKLMEGNVGFFTAWRLKAMGFDDGVAATCSLYVPQDEGALDYRMVEMAKPGAYITSSNQYVPQTLRLLDAMMDTEMTYSLYYGEKDSTSGNGWEYTDDNKVNPITSSSNEVNDFLGCNALFFGPAKYIDETFNWPEQRIEKTEYCQQYEEAGLLQKYSDDYLNIAPLTSEQQQENTLKETDIENAVKENMATFITEGVTDESWNSFVSLFDSMDVAGYINVYQDAIDTMDIQ